MPVQPTSEPLRRRASITFVADLGDVVLSRARSQHENGVSPFSLAQTGIAEIDDAVSTWWGVSTLAAESDRDLMAFAVHVAYSTAKAGGRILWVSLSGDVERPVLYLLAGIAGIPARSVFVERNLRTHDWAALASAREEIESLEIMVADGHGMSLEDLRTTCREAECGMPLDLVVVDGGAATDERYLRHLEDLSDERGHPFLVLVGTDKEPATPSPLRPGAVSLHLSRLIPVQGPARLCAEIRRVGRPEVRSVELAVSLGVPWVEAPRD